MTDGGAVGALGDGARGVTPESVHSCESLLRHKTSEDHEVTIPCVVSGLLKNI